MYDQRDVFLNKLGITQWVVRDFTTLFGEFIINISNTTKLIVITNENINFFIELLKDVFLLLNICYSNVIYIKSEQIKFIQKPIKIPCWVLGSNIDIKNINIMLISPSLSELSLNNFAKKELLRQICENCVF
ncbi:DNA polymerase III subunit psi [Candidatus Providencia siddallii]|uniref:DNA polymerase III subunit psi n=1 Tax=Candidatus Providencia siddallii TaxID=1715285 RepID=A0A0M6W797_9GAMM|nr:DNA polymerase III subunit psi [Candidatus Providencia siddallii]